MKITQQHSEYGLVTGSVKHMQQMTSLSKGDINVASV